MTFMAGAAEVVITPPVGTLLEGYGGRVGGAVGVHDDLHARAIVVDDGTTRAAVVACDLVGIDRHLTKLIRQLVHQGTDIPPAHVMVSATHTHAGPAGLRSDVDAALMDVTARKIAGAIVAARANMQPTALKYGRGNVDTVSQNRRDPHGPIDDRLSVLLFDSPDPSVPPIASIVNFACHATILYRTNMHISADYPGHTVATVKKVLGESPVLFLNGACGDVNPSWIEQNHSEAQRVGSIVGSEAARRLQELRPLGHSHRTWNIRWDELTERAITTGALVEEPRIRVASTSVDVATRVMDDVAVYREQIARLASEQTSVLPGDVEGRRRIMEQLTMRHGDVGVAARRREGMPTLLHPEVQAMSFGSGIGMLGLPGEFFVETADAIRNASGLEHLITACYTNHHVFYVVPKSAFGEGGYEPGVAVLDDAAADIFVKASVALLQEVAK